MSLTGLVVSVALVWAVLHAAQAYSRRHDRLPPLAGGRTRPTLLISSQVALHGLRLQVSTSAWNEHHDRLSGYLLRRRNQKLLVFLKMVYNVGVAASICGMLVVCGGLVWLVVSFSAKATAADSISNIFRRDAAFEAEDSNAAAFAMTLIIPGVTVPLSDLPFVLASVFVSQVLHEFGHALAAALDSVPILSCGASLTVIIPAAFVSLSTPLYRSLRTLAKARIVSAGPFHNLVMWGCLVFFRTAGLNHLLTSLFYQDISGSGRIVVGVDQASPLAGYLIPGVTLVKQLDDKALSTQNEAWLEYLEAHPAPLSRGWCVPEAKFSHGSCCPTKPGASPSSTCFLSFTSPHSSVGCTDPVPILTNSSGVRCGSQNDCGSEEQCSAPDTRQLIRLTVEQHRDGPDQVLVWNGPRHEIKDQVAVGIWRPRFVFPTINILEAHARLCSYLEMAALSLYLLNLLPVPLLDGMELARCLMRDRSRFRDIEDQG